MHIVEYKQFRDALRERYKSEVKQAEEEFDSQFKSYESQHGDYVKHADGVLKDLMANIETKKKAMIDWEERAEQRRQNAMEAAKRNKEGLENFQKQLSERQQLNMQGQNTNFGPLGKPWNGSTEGLKPTRPYHQLPAGLMAACIKLETKPFESVDPKDLQLVPNIQPSKRLIDALDEFYRPIPPTVQVKDNWIIGCLDDFFDAKTEALKNAAMRRKQSDQKSNSKPSESDTTSRKRKSRFSSARL
ncbi:unnamed protein product [Oikopleura dioica]|uniref:DUF7819 domain-containing protein n=1 Tax=Oikopleura dioica TaxID=34765 RepID=E4WQW6_OIKDI|nr:unnamed protein product [Oikopleura dioica]